MNIIKKSIDINNIHTIYELVIKQIEELFTKQWDYKYFIQKAKYNPNKNNVALVTFVNRMKLSNERIPEAYETFEYVIAKKYPYKKL
jgi:hypothetical protein